MPPRWTLRAELRLAFGVLLAAVAVVGVAGVAATSLSATYVEQVTGEVTPAMHANHELMQALTDMETGLRGYVLSAAPAALEPYRSGLRRLPQRRAQLQRLLAGDREGMRLLTRQNDAIDAWLREYAVPRVADPVGPGSFEGERFERAKRLFDRVRATVSDTERHLHHRLTGLSARAGQVRTVVVAGVAALTLACLVGGALTVRRATRRLRLPLARLRDVLTDLIAGDQDARVTPEGPRELVTISRAVNALADETQRLAALEAEERRLQERLLRFGRSVRGSLDPDEVVGRGLAELGESLRLDRAYVRLIEDARLLDVGRQWCASGVPELEQVPSPGPVELMDALGGRPLVSRDVLADAFVDSPGGREWQQVSGARGSIVIPVVVDDVPVAVVTCVDFAPRAWTGQEVHLVESVAADLGRALAQAKLYTAEVEAVHRLQELDRAKDEFLSSVSHELRTPLTSINGYVELLEDEEAGPVSAQQRSLLQVVRRNVDRLRVLIEDLLTLSRIESGAFRSTLQEVDLAALVRAGADDMRPQAAAGQVDVHVRLPDAPVRIHGDGGQLARALSNVLGNAIKFTPAGGQVRVVVRPEPRRGAVVVEIRDTGMGIPGPDQQRVFTRFFRAANAVEAGVPGTGLGLVIVRTIVDNHGGSLGLTSREGEGTTVTFHLPYAGVEDVSADAAASIEPAGPAGPAGIATSGRRL